MTVLCDSSVGKMAAPLSPGRLFSMEDVISSTGLFAEGVFSTAGIFARLRGTAGDRLGDCSVGTMAAPLLPGRLFFIEDVISSTGLFAEGVFSAAGIFARLRGTAGDAGQHLSERLLPASREQALTSLSGLE